MTPIRPNHKNGIILAIAAAALLSVSPANAADLAHVQQLKKTGSCENCDLRGAKLNGLSLKGANLKGAKLKGAQLGNSDMRGANLTGADLTGANLRGTDLKGANLKGASVAGAATKSTIYCNTTLAGGPISNRDCAKTK